MRTGKTAICDLIDALFRFLAEFVRDAAHRLDMHDPVPAERHLQKSLQIFLAPVIDQPHGVLVRAYASAIKDPFLIFVCKSSLQILVRQLAKDLIRRTLHGTAVLIYRLRVQFPGKRNDSLIVQFISRSNDRALSFAISSCATISSIRKICHIE